MCAIHLSLGAFFVIIPDMGSIEQSSRLQTPEQSNRAELSVALHALDTLRGRVMPVLRNGEPLSVVIEGSGQFGLTNLADNKKWAGIFHHSVLSGRIASHFAQRLQEQEYQTNPQRIINTMTFSHAGRRASEDARDFPETLDRFMGSGTAQAQLSLSNEVLGLRIIKGKVPDDEFQLVAALAHGNTEYPPKQEVLDSLDYRIAFYVDHRTTDRWQPYHERMGDFLVNNFHDGTKEAKDKIRGQVRDIVKLVFDRRKQQEIPEDQILKVEQSLENHFGITSKSERKTTRRDILNFVMADAQTEALLQKAGIDTDNINDQTVPMPEWERKIRHDYVAAARDEIINRFSQLREQTTTDAAFNETIDREFSVNGRLDWWGQIAREIHQQTETTQQKETEKLTPYDIGIATTTIYPTWEPLAEGLTRNVDDIDGVRGDMALQTIKKAVENGFQIVVVDNPKSSPAFKQALSVLAADQSNLHIYQEADRSTMSAGRRQAMEEVSGLDVKVIAWTEPEKISMVDNFMQVAQSLLTDDVDIVVPKRDNTAFSTYPAYQADWEKQANAEFNNLLRDHGLLPNDAEDLDAWIGPRLIKNDPDVLKLFLHTWELEQTDPKAENGKLDPELWPNAIFLPLVAALWRDKLLGRKHRIKSVPINYRHPPEQTRVEQDSTALQAKREQQFNNIIGATEALIQVFEYDQKHDQLYGKPRVK